MTASPDSLPPRVGAYPHPGKYHSKQWCTADPRDGGPLRNNKALYRCMWCRATKEEGGEWDLPDWVDPAPRIQPSGEDSTAVFAGRSAYWTVWRIERGLDGRHWRTSQCGEETVGGAMAQVSQFNRKMGRNPHVLFGVSPPGPSGQRIRWVYE